MTFADYFIYGVGVVTVFYSLALIIPRMLRKAILEVYREWHRLQSEMGIAHNEVVDYVGRRG